MKEYECQRCGISFLAGGSAKHCPACRKDINRERQHARAMARAEAEGRIVYTRICEVCGKEYRTLSATSQTCGKPCALMQQAKAARRPKTGRITAGYSAAVAAGYTGSYGDYQTAWYAQQAQSGPYNNAHQASGYTSLGEELRSGELQGVQ